MLSVGESDSSLVVVGEVVSQGVPPTSPTQSGALVAAILEVDASQPPAAEAVEAATTAPIQAATPNEATHILPATTTAIPKNEKEDRPRFTGWLFNLFSLTVKRDVQTLRQKLHAARQWARERPESRFGKADFGPLLLVLHPQGRRLRWQPVFDTLRNIGLEFSIRLPPRKARQTRKEAPSKGTPRRETPRRERETPKKETPRPNSYAAAARRAPALRVAKEAVKELERSYKEKEAALKAKDTIEARVEETLRKERKEKETTKKELESLRKRLNEAIKERDTTKEELSTMKKEKDASSTKEAHKEREAVTRELAAVKKERDAANKELEVAKKDLTAARKELDASKKELAAAKGAKDTELETVRKERDAVASILADRDATVEARQASITLLSKKLEEADSALRTAQRETEDFKSKQRQSWVSSETAQVEITSLKAELARTNDALSRLQESKDPLEKLFRFVVERYKALQQEHTEALASLSSVVTQLSRTESLLAGERQLRGCAEDGAQAARQQLRESLREAMLGSREVLEKFQAQAITNAQEMTLLQQQLTTTDVDRQLADGTAVATQQALEITREQLGAERQLTMDLTGRLSATTNAHALLMARSSKLLEDRWPHTAKADFRKELAKIAASESETLSAAIAQTIQWLFDLARKVNSTKEVQDRMSLAVAFLDRCHHLSSSLPFHQRSLWKNAVWPFFRNIDWGDNLAIGIASEDEALDPESQLYIPKLTFEARLYLDMTLKRISQLRCWNESSALTAARKILDQGDMYLSACVARILELFIDVEVEAANLGPEQRLKELHIVLCEAEDLIRPLTPQFQQTIRQMISSIMRHSRWGRVLARDWGELLLDYKSRAFASVADVRGCIVHTTLPIARSLILDRGRGTLLTCGDVEENPGPPPSCTCGAVSSHRPHAITCPRSRRYQQHSDDDGVAPAAAHPFRTDPTASFATAPILLALQAQYGDDTSSNNDNNNNHNSNGNNHNHNSNDNDNDNSTSSSNSSSSSDSSSTSSRSSSSPVPTRRGGARRTEALPPCTCPNRVPGRQGRHRPGCPRSRASRPAVAGVPYAQRTLPALPPAPTPAQDATLGVGWTMPFSLPELLAVTPRPLLHVPRPARTLLAEALGWALVQPRESKFWLVLAFGVLVAAMPPQGVNVVEDLHYKARLFLERKFIELRRHVLAGLPNQRSAARVTPPPPTTEEDEHQVGPGECSLADHVVNNAVETARRGWMSKAVQRLTPTTFAASSPEVLQRLRALHPASAPPPQALLDSLRATARPPATTVEEVLRALAGFAPGASGGQSPLRPAVVLCLARHPGSSVRPGLSSYVDDIICGEVPQEYRSVVYGARLFAIQKRDGGVRPIASGDIFRRIAAKIIAKRHAKTFTQTLTPHGQIGVAIPSGAEALAECVRQLGATVAPEDVVVKVDFTNAFNTVDRTKMLEAVLSQAPYMAHYAAAAYGAPTDLLLGQDVVSSASGVQQGDPLGPFLFSLALATVAKLDGCKARGWYLDDGFFVAPRNVALAQLRRLRDSARTIGLALNAGKTEIVEATPGTWHAPQEFPLVRPLSELEILGLPCAPDAAGLDAYLAKFVQRLSSRTSAVAQVATKDPHAGFLMLRLSCGFAAGCYLARSCGPRPEFNEVDALTVRAMDSIVPLPTNLLPVARLPFRMGGLGLRRLSEHAAPAHVASLNATKSLMALFLPPSALIAAVAAKERAAVTQLPQVAHAKYDELIVSNPQPHKLQRELSSAMDGAARSTLDFSVFGSRTKAKEMEARMSSVATPGASLYLVGPSSYDDHQELAWMEPRVFTTALRMRLGLAVQATSGRCGLCNNATVDAMGGHALSCMSSGYRTRMHNSLRDILGGVLRDSLLAPSLECHPFAQRPQSRIDVGVYLAGVQHLVDVALTNPVKNGSSTTAAIRTGGGAATEYESVKHAEYGALVGQHQTLVPFVVDTFGAMGNSAREFLQRIVPQYALQQALSRPVAHRLVFSRIATEAVRGAAKLVLKAATGSAFASHGNNNNNNGNNNNNNGNNNNNNYLPGGNVAAAAAAASAPAAAVGAP